MDFGAIQCSHFVAAPEVRRGAGGAQARLFQRPPPHPARRIASRFPPRSACCIPGLCTRCGFTQGGAAGVERKSSMCNCATMAAHEPGTMLHFSAQPIHGPKSSRSCGKTRSRCSGSTSVEPHDSASLRVVGRPMCRSWLGVLKLARWMGGVQNVQKQLAAKIWLAGPACDRAPGRAVRCFRSEHSYEGG
jgi:hypothetical protein